MSKEIANELADSAKQANVSNRSVSNVPIHRGISSSSPNFSEAGNVTLNY
jgi:hypothetical protein